MSFKWPYNPTLINGLPTLYVDKRGDDDSTGDGSAKKPYKTFAKVTDVGTAGNNIMVGEGIWEEQRTGTTKYFKWWGNGKCIIQYTGVVNFYQVRSDTYGLQDQFHFMTLNGLICSNTNTIALYDCIIIEMQPTGSNTKFFGERNYFYNTTYISNPTTNLCICCNNIFDTCSFCYNKINIGTTYNNRMTNNIFYNCGAVTANLPNSIYYDYNNFCGSSIPTTNGANAHSINDASTGQTYTDYFNSYALGDFTAKTGSANLGAGMKGYDIGFSLGLTVHATDDIFTVVGGATLTNVVLSTDHFELEQRCLQVVSATDTTIVLDSSASAVADYYNDLTIVIIDGVGKGIVRTITDYDESTHTVTVASLGVTLDTTSYYSISGRITSAIKDFGKIYKIYRNHLLGDLGYNDLAQNVWTEYLGINPLLTSFGMKHSKDDASLSGLDFEYYSANGMMLNDGTYGDADDSQVQANAIPIFLRYVQFDIPILVQDSL